MDLTRKCISIIGISIIVCLVLFCSAPRTLSFETNEGTLFDVRGLMDEAELVYDDGNIKLFRIPLPLGDAESYAEAEPMALPKAKVLTAHVSYDSNPFTTFPWVPVVEPVYHNCFFEILRNSDLIKIIVTITGPEPAKYKTDWIPAYPGDWYWFTVPRGYSTEGFYKLTVTVKPQRNKVYGASSEKSRFRVYGP